MEREATPEWLLRAIVDRLPVMVFVKEATELSFALFNRAGEDLLGLSEQEMLGKNDFDFFPEAQAQGFVDKDREVLAAGSVVTTEEPIEGPNGPRFLLSRKIPIHDTEGVPRYLLGVSFDITERRRAEERLKASNRELEESAAHNRELRDVLSGVVATEGLALIGHHAFEQVERARASLAEQDTEAADETLGALLAMAGSISQAPAPPIDLLPLVLEAIGTARAECHADRTVLACVEPAALRSVVATLIRVLHQLASTPDVVRLRVGEHHGRPIISLTHPSVDMSAVERASASHDHIAFAAAERVARSQGASLRVDRVGSQTQIDVLLFPSD
ncbi:MAG: PAS domain-containing protein [Sandaracinaceae bacterium]